MKIIFDATPMLANKTGVAFYTERLVTQLAAQYPDDIELVGFCFNFLGRQRTDHLPRATNLRYTGASLIPSKIVYQLRRFGLEIPLELLTRQRADFVLYNNFLGYPSLFHTPSAPVIHDLTYIDLPEYVSAKLRHDLERFMPRQIKRSKFIITVSEFSKQRICAVYGVDPARVIVTPIPPSAPVQHGTDTCQATLTKLGITKPYLLFLGTIEPRKNIPNLIDAYQHLSPELRASYQLVITGRIGWNCEIEKAKLAEVAGQGEIIHVGYVDDETKDILYQSAEYFVHASHYEGFGMPLLEAMSYGVPCIVSDIPVFHEVAGDAAAYFDQNSPDDIAAKMTGALTHPEQRQAFAAAGHKQVATFSWKTVAGRVYQAIKQAS